MSDPIARLTEQLQAAHTDMACWRHIAIEREKERDEALARVRALTTELSGRTFELAEVTKERDAYLAAGKQLAGRLKAGDADNGKFRAKAFELVEKELRAIHPKLLVQLYPSHVAVDGHDAGFGAAASFFEAVEALHGKGFEP